VLFFFQLSGLDQLEADSDVGRVLEVSRSEISDVENDDDDEEEDDEEDEEDNDEEDEDDEEDDYDNDMIYDILETLF
jgi:Sec-independent protein translocase protein TatA